VDGGGLPRQGTERGLDGIKFPRMKDSRQNVAGPGVDGKEGGLKDR